MIKVVCKECGMIHLTKESNTFLRCGGCAKLIEVPTGYPLKGACDER